MGHNVIKLAGADKIYPANGLNSLGNQAAISAKPSRLYYAHVTNTGANAYFVMVFDSATLPAEGATGVSSDPLPANSYWDLNRVAGMKFNNGIYIVISSTQTVKTISVFNDCFVNAGWREEP